MSLYRPRLSLVCTAMQRMIDSSTQQCEQLLSSFTRHIAELASEGSIIRQSLEKDRSTITHEEWISIVGKLHSHQVLLLLLKLSVLKPSSCQCNAMLISRVHNCALSYDQSDIMAELPIEAELGLFHVDCRVLRSRLQVPVEVAMHCTYHVQ